MSPRDLPPPTLVEDQAGLERLMDHLARQDEIAVDTEADSFFSYPEKVCLVQVTAEERDYLVDPLADLDFAPFGRVLADESKIKVFHDGEYDVLILKRDYGFEFAGLFDTRVAAAALGMEAPGLASVLQERFDVELDKSMQRSNWSERPLSDRQIDYARLDTHFLLPLMRELKDELEARGRSMIVEGECRRLEALVPPSGEFNPDDFVRLKGARNLDPRERRALRELFVLRERLARESCSPPFRVMSNQVMIELARRRPENSRQLTAISGFTPRMARKLGDPVLDALDQAAELDPIHKFPSLPRRDGTDRLSEIEVELYDRLKQLRKRVAEDQAIESSYLLNRHVLLRLAQARPDHVDRLEEEGLLSWQIDLFGESILELVREFERDVKRGAVPAKKRGRGPRRR